MKVMTKLLGKHLTSCLKMDSANAALKRGVMPINETEKLMNIRKLDHVGIRVMEFERAVQFYKKLEFQVIREDCNEHVVVMKHPKGVEINLLDSGDNENSGKNILMDASDKYPGYTHYAIEVQSVEAAKSFLESIDIKITEGPVTFGDGKTSIFVRDPDLNVIEFTELSKP